MRRARAWRLVGICSLPPLEETSAGSVSVQGQSQGKAARPELHGPRLLHAGAITLSPSAFVSPPTKCS